MSEYTTTQLKLTNNRLKKQVAGLQASHLSMVAQKRCLEQKIKTLTDSSQVMVPKKTYLAMLRVANLLMEDKR